MTGGVVWRLLKIAADVGGNASAVKTAPLAAGSSVESLLSAIRGLQESDFTHVVQEVAYEGLPPGVFGAMMDEAARSPDSAVVACGSSGRSVRAAMERLCFRLATGLHLAEPNTPYRLYPLVPLRGLAEHKHGRGWGPFELLVNLAWRKVHVRPVAVPDRISVSAGRWREFLRYMGLLLRRLVPGLSRERRDWPSVKLAEWLNPAKLLRTLLTEHASPYELALAAFVGVFMGALPLVACHTLAILYVTTRFRLNRAMAVAAQNLCAPPVVPLLCVEAGYFLRHGEWLTEMSRQTLLLELHQRLLDWLVGALFIGPLLGLITAGAVLIASRHVGRWSRRKGERGRISDRQRGNRLGYLSFAVALRLFGRRGAYGLLGAVTLYYLLFDPLARRLSLPYLRRRFPGHHGWRRAADIYRIFYNQGISLIDRFRMLIAPQAFVQEVVNYERVEPLIKDRSRGFVLLVSHVGNWQALMLALRLMKRNVTLLMRPEENPVNKEYLRFHDLGERLRMVSPDTLLGGVVELTHRFRQGDVIAIMGDRAYGAATMPAHFLGASAHFPRGPFQLAAAWECPVVVMFAAKTGTDKHTVEMTDVFRVERSGNREENLHRAIERYASLLEGFAKRYPYQVHLFEDVWAAPAVSAMDRSDHPQV